MIGNTFVCCILYTRVIRYTLNTVYTEKISSDSTKSFVI